MSGAKVTLTGGGGSSKTTVAGSDGLYSITGVISRSYTLQASAPSLIAEPVMAVLNAGIQTINFQLKVVPVAQQVTVEGTRRSRNARTWPPGFDG